MSARHPAIPLDGAIVAITGAARGIGPATAASFVRAGARVWIGDLDEAGARAAARELGERARAAPLDVTDSASFAAFLAAVRADGPLDVLVNNAGVMPLGGFVGEADAISRLTLDVNVWGLVLGMRLALPDMIARGRGHIVNVASMAGKIAIPGMAVYNASKFAAVGLSAAVRRELAGTGVSVSTVLPGAVRTELASGVPLGRGLPTVDPDDVAAAVIASCRDRRAELPVPGYLGGWSVLEALVPARVLDVGRALIGERRALTSIDPEARRAYVERVAAQARERAQPK